LIDSAIPGKIIVPPTAFFFFTGHPERLNGNEKLDAPGYLPAVQASEGSSMNSTSVLYVLDLLATIGVPVWLDGGWGVDALLGRITRSHDDLDLVLNLDDLTRVVELLVHNGFDIEEQAPGRRVLGHADHGQIDLHPVTFDARGNAVQVQPAASPVVYRRDGFVLGRILGRTVACFSADVQVFARLGRDRSEKHRRDVVALCSSFGLQVPDYWDGV
jgi:lincosamide nucleotidyltransferase A/C/D/E